MSEKVEICESHPTHKETIDKVKNQLANDETMFELADFFKAFGDSTRIKIMCALLETELCVCDISSIINISQSAVSHQLRVLRQTRLVKYRKEGKTVYYSLDDHHVELLIKQGLEHISHK